jgi:hypothetical protein
MKGTTKYSFVVKKKRIKRKMGKLNTCAMLITIYIQILEIFFSFNQPIIIINQTPFSFHVIIYLFGMQWTCWWSSQFFTIVMIFSKFSTYKWHCHKAINIPTRLNTFSISICDPIMAIICLAKNATFGNYLSWLCHQSRRSSHVIKGMDNLLNKYNFLVTSI